MRADGPSLGTRCRPSQTCAYIKKAAARACALCLYSICLAAADDLLPGVSLSFTASALIPPPPFFPVHKHLDKMKSIHLRHSLYSRTYAPRRVCICLPGSRQRWRARFRSHPSLWSSFSAVLHLSSLDPSRSRRSQAQNQGIRK